MQNVGRMTAGVRTLERTRVFRQAPHGIPSNDGHVDQPATNRPLTSIRDDCLTSRGISADIPSRMSARRFEVYRLTRPRSDRSASANSSGPASRMKMSITWPEALSLAVGARRRLVLLSAANRMARPYPW